MLRLYWLSGYTEYFQKDNPSNKTLPSLDQILKDFWHPFHKWTGFFSFAFLFIFSLLSSSMAKVFIAINSFCQFRLEVLCSAMHRDNFCGKLHLLLLFIFLQIIFLFVWNSFFKMCELLVVLWYTSFALTQ